jgi:hypothetical protein
VWPAAADVVFLDVDLAGAYPERAIRDRMKMCTYSSASASRGCIIFLHTETLQVSSGEILNFLNSNITKKIVLLSSSNSDKCVPWWGIQSDGSTTLEFKALSDLLEHENLIVWFTENPCIEHPKVSLKCGFYIMLKF